MNTKKGFTLIEILVSVSLLSVLSYVAVLNLKEFYNPLDTASIQIQSHYKLVRSSAIANTKAYLYQPLSDTQIQISSRETCNSGSWTIDPTLALTLIDGAVLNSTEWFVCINSRGFPDANVVFQLDDQDGKTKNIEIFLGGGIEES